MSGCLGWMIFGAAFAAFKILAGVFRAIWSANLFIIQMVAGRPLYYCGPAYSIPATILGTLGVLLIIAAALLVLAASGAASMRAGGLSPTSVLFLVGIGIGLLLVSRFLIRRGSL